MTIDGVVVFKKGKHKKNDDSAIYVTLAIFLILKTVGTRFRERRWNSCAENALILFLS